MDLELRVEKLERQNKRGASCLTGASRGAMVYYVYGTNSIYMSSEEAATKLLYLALQNIANKWTKPIKNWRKALNQFAIFFEGRVPTQ